MQRRARVARSPQSAIFSRQIRGDPALPSIYGHAVMTHSIRRLRFRSLTLVPCLLASAVAFAQSTPATAKQPVSSLDTQAFARSGQIWR
ncbi:MAG: polyvinylalcohol dehydrogenase, partial [Methanosarcinales archaeon]